MRKLFLLFTLALCCIGLEAQNYHIRLHNSSTVIYNHDVNVIEEIHFQGNNPARILINDEAGTYSFPITSFDSITFYVDEVIPPTQGNDYMTICDSELPYTWQGVTFTEGGTQIVTLQTPQGADSLVALHLTVYPTQYSDDYMSVCESELPYVWQGLTFTEARAKPIVLQSAQGCDSIVTLHLSVYPTETSDDYLTVTQSQLPYVWQGVTFTEEGTQTITLQTIHGCDSIVNLHLTVGAEPVGDTVYITYNGNNVNVINPFASSGVTVTNSNAEVTVNATRANVPYVVSGTSSNGSLTFNSSNPFFLALSSLSLTSGSTAAINIASPVAVTMQLRGSSAIADNANSAVNGAIYAAGALTVNGNGTLQVTGNAKHGILVEGIMTVNSGTINIPSTDSDGIHGSSNLVWNNGTINIVAPGSDGLDFTGTVTIANGNLTINTTTLSQRSIKVTGAFSMTGGTLHININGDDCKGIKSDGTLNVTGGSINITHSGNTSKGLSSDGDINISGGTIVINSNGTTVVTNYDPSYCTAIKGDANVNISGGNITITLPTANKGGKGIKCAGNMTISGNNTINIDTHGDGATYTASSGNDAYSSSCLRSEGNMSIQSGNITLTSSGAGGKGIKVGTKNGNTYTGTYTQGVSGGTGPTLTVSTTGSEVGSSGGGGGGWPPGGGGSSSAHASAKGIKVGGLATIYGGTTTVTTTKNKAEGLESKTQINFEGGQHYFHCYDDCINSAGKIFFNGGITVCYGYGNDAIDSNAGTAGAITIGNGVVFTYTTKGSPEEGFDCDNNSYIRITGTGIGISAGGSQGGGGGWPGGGGNTITGAVQGYHFHTSSVSYQAGRYYTLSNSSGTNLVTFSFEANCSSTLSLITATGMVSGGTYYVKYGNNAPTNPTTSFHGIYLGGTSSASTQAFSFTAQ